VRVIGNKLIWNAAVNAKIRSWTVYQQQGENWTLHKILPEEITEAELAPGTYAVCAVDRLVNESLGVVASIQ
jgi:hypothetical protein